MLHTPTLTTPDTTQQKLDASFGVALQRLAERHPRQVNILQPTEPDGTDAQPNEPAPMPAPEPVEQITYINGDPRVYDWLGEIQWTADRVCLTCGHTEFHIHTAFYDGCYREMPECSRCDAPIIGLPVDETARQLVIEKRKG